MAVVHTDRMASAAETAAEMDRRGHVIETLEAEVEALKKECDLLRKMQKPAGDIGLLYEIRRAMGWNDKTSLSIMPNGVKDLRKDALRYQYLRDHCSSHYPMTHEQPAEWSIIWEFQQGKPHEAWGSFDRWIDEDIARLQSLEAAIAAEEAAEAAQSPDSKTEGV